MKKRGISLIVLIITIVVIIILATAIIVNVAQTNIIENANEAVVKQDFKTFQDELLLYEADKYASTNGSFDVSTFNADKTTDPTVYNVIPSLEKSKYKDYVTVETGRIKLSDDIDEDIKKWASEVIVIGSTNNSNDINITKIKDTTDFIKFVNEVNSGVSYEGKVIKLDNNIDLDNICGKGKGNWIPIGSYEHPFKGIFDGNGKTIENLYIDADDMDSYGLFGYVSDCEIKNLTVGGEITTNAELAGGIIYSAENATISGIVNNVDVKSNYIAGGIICVVNKENTEVTISNCTNNGDITVINNISGKYGYLGGIIGYTLFADKVTIVRCKNSGTIDGESNSIAFVGGILGENDLVKNFEIIDSYNFGELKGNSVSFVGGIIGYYNNYQNTENIYLNVSNTYNTGIITTSSSNKGGFMGFLEKSDNRKIVLNLQNVYWEVGKGVSQSIGNQATVNGCEGKNKEFMDNLF